MLSNITKGTLNEKKSDVLLQLYNYTNFGAWRTVTLY